ncbi:MAG: hypothetical protein E4H03_06610 [Myxococcales bacterium]|nr:MAG: hypothetical protein E4H03_06610 [Myxococcales bacterium]
MKTRSGPSTLFPHKVGLVIAAASGIALLLHGSGEDGIRAGLRLTAHCSLTFFLAAFAASSLIRFSPGPATPRLRAGRRQLGLSFAASHIVHLHAIMALIASTGFHVDPITRVSGGLAFLFIALVSAAGLRLSGAGRSAGAS